MTIASFHIARRLRVSSIEPDDCFYIQNYKVVRGKNRLDLSADPTPDLALETDLTSKTDLKRMKSAQYATFYQQLSLHSP
jgi:Uma2 family endonuclease